MVFAMLKKLIAIRIKELRLHKGFTQEQLAEKADINQFHLSKIEREQDVNITLELLDKIIHGLDCTYDEFFNFETSDDDVKQLLHELSLNEHKDDLLKNFINIAKSTK